MNDPGIPGFRDPALADFGVDSRGVGRRLERLGGLLVDRPLPQTTAARGRPAAWSSAALTFAVDPAAPPGAARGRWHAAAALPDPWQVRIPLDVATLVLEVRPAPSGQVGVFLEQIPQWRWLAARTPPTAPVLSLFAHSGAATLALAAAGAEVVHVDASRQAVALARRNAAASGLDDRPIRWLCEDAVTFVRRQMRRGARFAGAVLDPPTWGHGPNGEAFAIDRDLVPLVADIAGLLRTDGGMPAGPLLLTCHSPGWHPGRLRDTLSSASGAAVAIESGPLTCHDDAGRPLELGCFARWAPTP